MNHGVVICRLNIRKSARASCQNGDTKTSSWRVLHQNHQIIFKEPRKSLEVVFRSSSRTKLPMTEHGKEWQREHMVKPRRLKVSIESIGGLMEAGGGYHLNGRFSTPLDWNCVEFLASVLPLNCQRLLGVFDGAVWLHRRWRRFARHQGEAVFHSPATGAQTHRCHPLAPFQSTGKRQQSKAAPNENFTNETAAFIWVLFICAMQSFNPLD